MRSTLVLLGFALLVLLPVVLFPDFAHATQIMNWPLERVVADADSIVVGHVVEQRTLRVGQQILTESRVQVEDDLLKRERTELVVTQLGGRLGTRVAEVVGSVPLQVGQRVLLMTKLNADGRWYVVGLSLGLYIADGEVLRQNISIPLLDTDGTVVPAPGDRITTLNHVLDAIAVTQ